MIVASARHLPSEEDLIRALGLKRVFLGWKVVSASKSGMTFADSGFCLWLPTCLSSEVSSRKKKQEKKGESCHRGGTLVALSNSNIPPGAFCASQLNPRRAVLRSASDLSQTVDGPVISRDVLWATLPPF